MVIDPINLKNWIDENRALLKPPVGNSVIYDETQDFIIMVVGGPNSRKDYHINQTEEFFYQLEGNIMVKTQQDGVVVDIPIEEGEIFLLPANVPHSPQRGPNTVGIVIERVRDKDMQDQFRWYCEKCNNQLYNTELYVDDIVAKLPPVMEKFYASEELRSCDVCGAVMSPPELKT